MDLVRLAFPGEHTSSDRLQGPQHRRKRGRNSRPVCRWRRL